LRAAGIDVQVVARAGVQDVGARTGLDRVDARPASTVSVPEPVVIVSLPAPLVTVLSPEATPMMTNWIAFVMPVNVTSALELELVEPLRSKVRMLVPRRPSAPEPVMMML
jgi:hypothetical protein